MRYLAEMTFAEMREMREDAVVILPIGAIEAHGPHLPLQTDVIIARAMAASGARALEASGFADVVVAPPLQWTSAGFAAAFAGTQSLSPATVTAILVETALGLHRAGFAHILLANAHLDPAHTASLHEGVRVAQAQHGVVVTFPDITRKPWALRLTAEFKSGACHAGQFETSVVMVERPDLVRTLALYDPVAFGVLFEAAAAADARAEVADLVARSALSDPALQGSELWFRAFMTYWGGEQAWDMLPAEARAEALRVGRKVAREVQSVLGDRAPAAAYSGVRAPTLLLTGERTPLAAREVGRLLHGALPRAERVVIPGAGHAGPLTHAVSVNELILAHVTRAE